jgi:hypothetical protein
LVQRKFVDVHFSVMYLKKLASFVDSPRENVTNIYVGKSYEELKLTWKGLDR